jgi:hypothetical protein
MQYRRLGERRRSERRCQVTEASSWDGGERRSCGRRVLARRRKPVIVDIKAVQKITKHWEVISIKKRQIELPLEADKLTAAKLISTSD